MTLMEQVNNDIKEAMKAKQQERLDALRMLKAEYIKNNTAAKPTDELSVTIAHNKRLQDSLEMYEKGSDAHAKILKEMDVLKAYLPQAMSEEEAFAHESGYTGAVMASEDAKEGPRAFAEKRTPDFKRR